MDAVASAELGPRGAPVNDRSRAPAAVPRHVAIVMDGNGRWAKSRYMPRFFGHKQGVDALVRTVLACADRGVEYLTVFAFSSENWKRPTEEVSGLMGLVLVAVSKYLAKLAGDGVRIRIVGDRTQVSDKLRAAWQQAEDSTRDNTRITLSVAFNYGGRWDIVQACRQAMAAGVPPEELDEARLNAYMALSYAPDPDLFIRTGGEVRISNFLLWQAAYSELVFTDCLWPEFGTAELDAALAEYAGRERRFGTVSSRPALRRRGKLTRAQAAHPHRAGAAGLPAAGAAGQAGVAVRLAGRDRDRCRRLGMGPPATAPAGPRSPSASASASPACSPSSPAGQRARRASSGGRRWRSGCSAAPGCCAAEWPAGRGCRGRCASASASSPSGSAGSPWSMPGRGGLNYILSIFVLVWTADVFAYFGGRAFGKRKLAPAISPGKSWAGVWSGMVGTLLVAGAWVVFDGRGLAYYDSFYTLVNERVDDHRPGARGRLPGGDERGRRPVRVAGQAQRRRQGQQRPAARPWRHPRPHRRAAAGVPDRARARAAAMNAAASSRPQRVCILGATGSVGMATLDVIARHPERFEVVGLTAQHRLDELFALVPASSSRSTRSSPTAEGAATLGRRLAEAGVRTRGAPRRRRARASSPAQDDVDTVMAAIVGAAGLAPCLAAARAGKRLLLANKEALVVGGELFMRAVQEGGATLLPIDSEHSAIFQCLPDDRAPLERAHRPHRPHRLGRPVPRPRCRRRSATSRPTRPAPIRTG